MKIRDYIIFIFALLISGAVSCVDLDLTPRSTLSSDIYFEKASQMQAYVAGLYRDGNNGTTQVFTVNPTGSRYGTFGIDGDTDNQCNKVYNSRWVPGEWLVGASGGDWSFSRIYKINFFFDKVLPRLEAGSISGSTNDINQALGEVYFFRSYEYFEKMRILGDFPIITDLLPNDMDVLTAVSERRPMTEVAHFVIEELDKAISLLNTNTTFRINRNAALLFKSRVALYMGTWLKYFAGTPFVPNGPGWPGAATHANYQFPAGSLEAESKWFLQQAVNAAKQVADAVPLVENNGVVRLVASDPHNSYYTMFGDVNLDNYKEVVFYKQVTAEQGTKHAVANTVRGGSGGMGLTRGFVDNFLMANGLPIYAPGSGYHGDDYITDVRKDRDGRLFLFLKEPGQPNMLDNVAAGTWDEGINSLIEQYPSITLGDEARYCATGYQPRKGGSYDGNQATGNSACYTSSIIFRGVEAYLNYIEAYYELNGNLDATAQDYWVKIRNRAKVDSDFQKTINATDMTIEATNDWGAFSGGELLTDKVLYNIRRERRCELMCEALRLFDLRRWRALDQMITTEYHIEGFKIWGPMKDEPTAPWNDGRQAKLICFPEANANVSPPSSSIYIRPNQFSTGSTLFKNGVPKGYSWAMAHYLNPIAVEHFLITAPDKATVSQSTIYQNPYWPIEAGKGAIQ